MRMFGRRRQPRQPAKRGDGVSWAAPGHRLRNPRPSRSRFPGPAGHRGLMARDARAAGRVAGSGVGVVCRAPHTAHHPRGSGKTGRKATSSWHGGLEPPIPPGPP